MKDEYIETLMTSVINADKKGNGTYVLLDDEEEKLYFNIGLVYMYYHDNLKEVDKLLKLYNNVISRERFKECGYIHNITEGQRHYMITLYDVYNLGKKSKSRKKAVTRLAIYYGKIALKYDRIKLISLLHSELKYNRNSNIIVNGRGAKRGN